MINRWRKEKRELGRQAFVGQGVSRDEELTRLKRELAKVTKERDFLGSAAAYFAKETK
jgi:transposase